MSRKIKELTISKERRQVELLSVIQNAPTLLSLSELCEIMHVEKATVQRDLQDLRRQGIHIHSIQRKVQIIEGMDEAIYKQLLNQYIASIGHIIGYPLSISFLVTKLKWKAVDYFITLTKAIELSQIIEIVYHEFSTGKVVTRQVEPYDIVSTHRDWRLIAVSRLDHRYKQYLIDHIKEMKLLYQFFSRRSDYSRESIYRHSFNFYRGSKEVLVEIIFTPKAAPRIRSEIFTDEQEIILDERKFVTLKMRVNTLEEVANWVLSFGGEAKVLSPPELRDLVLKKAGDAVFANKM